MAYRFELDESLAESIRRIGCEQIDQAVDHLTRGGDPNHGIHQARKALKRLRALLRLTRTSMRDKDFQSENRSLRDVARILSQARDSQAMLEAIGKLSRFNGPSAAAGTERVSALIKDQRGAALKSLEGGPKDVAMTALREARRRFGQLRVKGGFERLGEGLQRSYGGGRRAFERAYARGQDEDFHEWRKRVQQHWRHMQLLESAWPESLKARIDLARELSQLLGDDQDLSMLRERLAAEAERTGVTPESEALIEAARARQAELRSAAEPRGRRLFVERPRAFRSRMTACWKTARKLSGRGAPGEGAAQVASAPAGESAALAPLPAAP